MDKDELKIRIWNIFCLGEQSGAAFEAGHDKSGRSYTDQAEKLIVKLVEEIEELQTPEQYVKERAIFDEYLTTTGKYLLK